MSAEKLVAPPMGAEPRASRSSSRGRPLLLFGIPAAFVLFFVALRAFDANQTGWLNNFLLVFVGLLLEAAPFILLGAAVSSAIEVWVPARVFERIADAPTRMQVAVASLGGLVFPVCECASVPVARRLFLKGLSPAAAVTFMLSAPIVNPVVIFSTWFAFRGLGIEWMMVGGRVVMGLAIAILVGLIVQRYARATQAAVFLSRPRAIEHHGHDHAGERAYSNNFDRAGQFVTQAGAEFLTLMRFMLVGAAVVATLQTLVPQSFINVFAENPILAILAMMLLAFLLALCSESDAILVSAFTQFSPVAQLAFLVLGPMLDVKLVALYVGSFGRRFALVLSVSIVVLVLVLFLWLELVYGLLV